MTGGDMMSVTTLEKSNTGSEPILMLSVSCISFKTKLKGTNAG
jgi:hypothetical protein